MHICSYSNRRTVNSLYDDDSDDDDDTELLYRAGCTTNLQQIEIEAQQSSREPRDDDASRHAHSVVHKVTKVDD